MGRTNKKFIPYGRQYIDKQDIDAVISVLRSSFLTQGPEIERFERELCKKTGAKYAVAVANGTAALHLACLAIGVCKGDEVITSPLSFVASSNCVLYCGGKPVFVDVDAKTGNMGVDGLETCITKHTKAIIPVHLSGCPCDMKAIRSLAKRKGLSVIEDACHALGASYAGTPVGSCAFSDMTVFSFHPVKHVTTGEGGAITTNSKKMYETLRTMRSHGIVKDDARFSQKVGSWYYEQHALGFNYRMTDIQAALGVSQLKKLTRFVRRRRQIVKKYFKAFSSCENLVCPPEETLNFSSWHLFIIRIKDSEKRRIVFEELRARDLGVQVHYIPIHTQPYYRKHVAMRKSSFPEAERYYESCISLPLFPAMTDDEIAYVIDAVKEACG